MGQDRWASWAPTDPQEAARWVRTRWRNWRDHVDRMGQDRWASWAPTDPQEDRLKDGERPVRVRQKRTHTDKQQNRVLKEKKEKNLFLKTNTKISAIRNKTKDVTFLGGKNKNLSLWACCWRQTL
jgi:hypothetical protein